MTLLTSAAAGDIPKYSDAEFLVGGNKDVHGELKQVYFKIHEGYVADAYEVMRERKFPYRNISDLARHAFVRHVKWLWTLEQWENSVLQELAQIDEIVGHAEMKLRFAKSIESIGPMVDSLLGMPSGVNEAGRALRRIKGRIDMMHAGFWRDHCLTLFMQRFGPYLHAGIVLLGSGGGNGGSAGSGSDGEEGNDVDIEDELTQIVRKM